MANYNKIVNYYGSVTLNRRPVSRQEELPVSYLPAMNTGSGIASSFIRSSRHSPTVRQFSGTVVPNEIRKISLIQLATGDILETTMSDSSGVFSFRGWYPPLTDFYAFRFHAGNGYNEKTFPLLPPVEQIWRGDPTRNDSAA